MDFATLFNVKARYGILVCNSCQYAVPPAHVQRHLKDHHKRLTLEQRRSILVEVRTHNELAQSRGDVVYPLPNEPPVDGLPVFFDGLRCNAIDDNGQKCGYICRAPRRIRKHCDQCHGWVNEQKRGGNARLKQVHATNKIWTCNHACQQFFKEGAWKRFFEVSSQHHLSIHCGQKSERQAFFQSQLESIAAAERNASSDADRVQGFDDHRSTVVPWLRETSIADHLRGLRKDEIKGVIALPSPGENDGLRHITEATEMMLREAHSWCFDGTDCMLTWPCRVVLSRFQSSQTESFGKIRPFDPHKEPNTLRTYFTLAKKVLVYFDRVAAGDDYFFSAELEEESFRPEDHVDPTEEQLDAWKALRALANHQMADDDEEKRSELKGRLLGFWMLLVC